MKKVLLIGLAICLISCTVYAQSRGALTNVFASWYSVTSSATTISLPYNSRDVWIRNGDSADSIWVSLKGNSIPVNQAQNVSNLKSASAINPDIVELDAGTELSLSDFVTNSMSMVSINTASPVTVIVTY